MPRGANVTSYHATGLTAATHYQFRVCAVNGNLCSGYSNIADVTTQVAPPIAPTNLRQNNVWSTKVDLAWNDPNKASSKVSNFVIQISTDGKTWQTLTTVSGDKTAYRATGLKARTTYYFRVQATNVSGSSAWSSVFSVKTTAG